MKERELLWRAERKAVTVPELTAIAKRWHDELSDGNPPDNISALTGQAFPDGQFFIQKGGAASFPLPAGRQQQCCGPPLV